MGRLVIHTGGPYRLPKTIGALVPRTEQSQHGGPLAGDPAERPDGLRLSVAPDQERFVSANAVSFAEAYVKAEAKPFAVLAHEQIVGFAMLYDDGELPVVGIWRMMIDHSHQGHGYGAETVQALVRHVHGLRPLDAVEVGAMPGAGGPGPFYERQGFEPTGDVREDGEVRYRLRLG